MNYYSPYYLHTRRNICIYVFAYLTFVSISNYSPSKQPENLSRSNLSSDILRQIWDVSPIRQYLQNIKYALHCVLIFSLSSWGIKSFFFCFILQVSLSHTNSRMLSLVEDHSATWHKLFKQFNFSKSSIIDQAVKGENGLQFQLSKGKITILTVFYSVS